MVVCGYYISAETVIAMRSSRTRNYNLKHTKTIDLRIKPGECAIFPSELQILITDSTYSGRKPIDFE